MRLLRLAALVLLGPSPRTEARAKKKAAAEVWGSGGWPVAPGGGAKGDDECTIARKTACRTDGGGHGTDGGGHDAASDGKLLGIGDGKRWGAA